MNEVEGASRTDFFGYQDCVRLDNGAPGSTSVVLGHHCGGRVLEYALAGQNALYLDPAHQGWTYGPGQPLFGPSGGRMDIGPEHTIPRHPALWLGAWTAEITGPRAARLTSVPDEATGVQLLRDFTLAADSSHLVCTQTMTNVSNATTRWNYWARTFALGGGIAMVPLTAGSRFPRDYVMYGPGAAIGFRPEDPNVRRRDGFLEVLGPTQFPKLGFDSHAGWLAYLTRTNLLLVKEFPTFPERVYGEVAGLTISVWYPDGPMCELEPIGPRELLEPGESASFTEEWWLLPWQFPASGEQVDLEAVGQAVTRSA